MDAIIYTSNTGSTEQYAKLLAQKTGFPAYSLAEAKKRDFAGAEVIYLGWIMAGSVTGYAEAAKRYQVRAVCGVGMGQTGTQTESVRKKSAIPANIPLFTLQGNFNVKKLHGIYRFMMEIMVKTAGKSLAKKKKADAAFVSLVSYLIWLSLPVIQLGGGLLICRTALQWLGDSDSSVGRTQGKDVNPIHKSAIESQIFYPITFPISIGPGSVSVILTLMASVSMKNGWARGLLFYAIIALVIVLMCLILYLFLSQGERIIRKIGNSGSIVINKMVAFFTFCVGVQIVVTGIAKLFNLHV